jgi:hypothetical protein
VTIGRAIGPGVGVTAIGGGGASACGPTIGGMGGSDGVSG